MNNFTMNPTPTPRGDEERAQLLSSPGWGDVFTDNMVSIAWDVDHGWHDATLRPYGPLPLPPAASVLNYGQAVFEGLKLYRQPDASVAAFRPYMNAERFQRSARRLAMPELPLDLFVDAVELIARSEERWVPSRPGETLYLRPLMIATDARLATRPSQSYLFVVFASPVGDYFPNGVQPVSVWLSQDYARAAPGGTGEAKFAGNYAAAMLAQREAADHGCDQVVWLDSVGRTRVEEMGGMNLFIVTRDHEIVTPALTGTLLAGVTRDSLLQLSGTLGYRPVERTVTVSEFERDATSGQIIEAFACGTAAVVTPVGRVKHAAGEFQISDGGTGKVTAQLRQALLDVQFGEAPDPLGWRHPITAVRAGAPE